jgi:hypothetical protein
LDGLTKKISSTIVKKTFGAEKNKLVMKPMGIVVARFLYQHFAPLFAFSYTKQTEQLLDNIHQGTANWIEVCVSQKEYLSRMIKTAKENKIEKFHIPIDENHCYMIAKYGPVIRQGRMSGGGGGEEKEEEEGTTATPTVKWLPVRKDIDLLRLEKGEYTLADLLQTKAEPGTPAYFADHTPGGIPLYGGQYFGVFQDKEIIVRKGKFGRYAVWGEENRSLKCFGRRNLENITMEEMTVVLAKPKRKLGGLPAQTTEQGSTKLAGDPLPSEGSSIHVTPSIEQIPITPAKKRKVPLAPKAPTPIPNNPTTPSGTEPPKKRGRPAKKSENIIIEK